MIIPEGSLDEDPGERPRRHVHWSSQAAWESAAQDLPKSD